MTRNNNTQKQDKLENNKRVLEHLKKLQKKSSHTSNSNEIFNHSLINH
jgi:hypothetical protein